MLEVLGVARRARLGGVEAVRRLAAQELRTSVMRGTSPQPKANLTERARAKAWAQVLEAYSTAGEDLGSE